MSKKPSIAQEFYKVQELWADIDPLKDWILAIWAVDYQDLDIVDKFLEIERSPLGKFNDIFFRFDTEYKGDNQIFEKSLYEEYLSWFKKPKEDMQDMMDALRNDGMLLNDYVPNEKLEPTATNLWKEMLRLKNSIKDLEETKFCIYIPPTRTDGEPLTNWFSEMIDTAPKEELRFVTIDYAKHRKVKLKESQKIKILRPKLNMTEAIKNEMDKGCNTYDEVSVSERFSKQISTVMECTVGSKSSRINKEVKILLSLAKETGVVSSQISGLMIASQAFYAVKEYNKSEKYADEAIIESEKAMQANDPSAYAIWKSSVMLKAATLINKGKRSEAIRYYEKMAEVASKRGDAYSTMEGYRMSGYLYYELRDSEKALEYNLLALASGSYLNEEVRQGSTFLIAASLAYHLCKNNRPFSDQEILEEQLKVWLGNDWKQLVESEEMKNSTTRKKASIFS